MSDCKPVSIPIDRSCYSIDETETVVERPYRELIGSLMYLAIATRPDIAFAVGFLSRYLDRPTEKHWQAANKVLRYLKGTMKYGLQYSSNPGEEYRFFSDADFAADPLSRKSVSGQIILGNGGALLWSSSRQVATSLSSTESELMAACEVSKSSVWFRNFLNELGYPIVPTIQIDNLSTIRLVKDDQFHKRTKHIDVRNFFIRELLESGEIAVAHVPTDKQLADILTKPLARPQFERLRNQLMKPRISDQ